MRCSCASSKVGRATLSEPINCLKCSTFGDRRTHDGPPQSGHLVRPGGTAPVRRNGRQMTGAWGPPQGEPAAASEEALLRGARAGQRAAVERLYAGHVASARRLATILAGPAGADALVAESFARAFGQVRAGRGPSTSFGPLLLTTLRDLHRSSGGTYVRPTVASSGPGSHGSVRSVSRPNPDVACSAPLRGLCWNRSERDPPVRSSACWCRCGSRSFGVALCASSAVRGRGAVPAPPESGPEAGRVNRVVRGSWDILFCRVPRKTRPRFYCDHSICTAIDRSESLSPSAGP